MLTYILVTLTILIVILCFTVFYEYRQINQLTLTVQRNFADMAALRHVLDNCSRPSTSEANFPFVIDEEDSDDTNNDDDDDDDSKEVDGNDNDNDNDKEVSSNDNNKEVPSNDDSKEVETTKDLDEIDAVLDQMENDAPAAAEAMKEVEVEVTLNDKSKKTTPDEPAKNFADGYKLLSTNDNKYYVVTSTKAGVKRWRKID